MAEGKLPNGTQRLLHKGGCSNEDPHSEVLGLERIIFSKEEVIWLRDARALYRHGPDWDYHDRPLKLARSDARDCRYSAYQLAAGILAGLGNEELERLRLEQSYPIHREAPRKLR